MSDAAGEADIPLVSAYLIHFGEPHWCAAAATSLLASVGVRLEVGVVDNGPPGCEPPLRSVLPLAVRVLEQPANLGYAGGANIALRDWRGRRAGESYIVIGSHDLHVEPETLQRLVTVARSEPRAGVVAPVLTAPHPSSGGIWNGRHTFQVSPAFVPEEVSEHDWASGTCLLITPACADDVGDFDERLGSYVEDADYGLRVNDAGWRVLVVKSARARGLGSSSTSSIAAITANTVRLGAKRAGWRGALATGSLFVGWTLQSYVASVLPWRPPERRARSRCYARQRTLGMLRLVSRRPR